jgi:deferrochelatase/peroxidase EfeB
MALTDSPQREYINAAPRPAFVPFEGQHQTGVTALPIPEQGLVASFNVHSKDRAALKSTLQELTEEIRGLMVGKPPETRDPAYPPVDSGILGEQPPPDNLSTVVGVGASLFDDRFGLADRKPKELATMPFLANDRLDPKLSHGDISIIFEAGHNDTVQFALRQLMRRTRSDLVLKWMIDGNARGIGAGRASEAATPRNLLGFKDGTANLNVDDNTLMDRHVWVGPDDGEPDWAVGGPIRPCASSGCSSSSGTAPSSSSRKRSSAGPRSAAPRWA